MLKSLCVFVCLLMTFFLGGALVSADTIVMKDNERIKGVVVEDYKDRVVMSTMDGEKEIMKDGIKDILYDLEEQNLTNLGDFYQDHRMYQKAYYYYGKALEVNPRYKKAKDGLNYVGTYLQQTSRMEKLDHIQRMNELKKWEKPGSGSLVAPSKEDEIKKTLGIGLKNVKDSFKVYDVVPGSPASTAGVKKGDLLTAAWGRSISYMQPEEVMDKLLSPGVMDVHISVLRKVTVDMKKELGGYKEILGAELGFSEMEGLIVKKVNAKSAAMDAGIKEGDVLVSIKGKSTRYMSMEEATRIIVAHKGGPLSFKIKRDLVIWKKFKGIE